MLCFKNDVAKNNGPFFPKIVVALTMVIYPPSNDIFDIFGPRCCENLIVGGPEETQRNYEKLVWVNMGTTLHLDTFGTIALRIS